MSDLETERDAPAPAGRRGRGLWPRPETTLLVLGLLWTLGAKFAVVRGQQPERLVFAVLDACLPDFVFFAAIFAAFAIARLMPWYAVIARVTVLAATAVLGWSIANAAWLIATSVQLQPGVLLVLLEEPGQFWPVVQAHLERNLLVAIPILLTLAVGVGWLLWRLVRPVAVRGSWQGHVALATLGAAVALALSVGHRTATGGIPRAYSGEVIGFSSHWFALLRTVAGHARGDDVDAPLRELPRIGERELGTPPASAPRPNVVIVLLESVSLEASGLGPGPAGGPETVRRDTMPTLRRLAAEGVEFESTRVPIAQTSKAFWATFTGSTPDLASDYAEAVHSDRPYESLPSILGADGYRSAFFQMSKGTFECAPGLFANLAFDWAWFLENLEDESSHLGYLGGDDFRMIEPMFEWVDGSDEPFLLTLISCVAHDPYDLPAWYEHEPRDDRYERYLQAVRFTDDFLAEIERQLVARGLADDTLICVLGDHGEGFRPESRKGRWAPFEEVIRVPWVIRWPEHVAAGRSVASPCSQLDVVPTILTLLGYDVARAGFDGVDALGPIDEGRRIHFWSWYEESPIGYVQGDVKHVYWPYTDTLFTYDLARDPGETSPVVAEGEGKTRVVDDVLRWKAASQLRIPARRFRERLEFDHWRTFSSGRSAWAYYVP